MARRKQTAADVGCKESWAVGETAHFEYHCLRSHDSQDAELWYRSHEEVTIVEAGEHLYSVAPSLDDIFKRGEAGQPKAYNVRFADGHVRGATEDELFVAAKFLDPEMRPPPPDEIAAARAARSPAFEPKIGPLGLSGDLFYTDGRVIGAVDLWEDAGRKGITIHEWSSHLHGRGHTVEALTWLRERFDVIVANGVGSVEDGVGDIATAYWEHMRSKGLADVLVLDDGSELAPSAPDGVDLPRAGEPATLMSSEEKTVMKTFEPSAALKGFLAAELRNEAHGGDAPTTLGSAFDSLKQMPADVFKELNADTAAGDYLTVAGELNRAITEHGRDFEVAPVIDVAPVLAP